MSIIEKNGYSATVDLQLHSQGQVIPLSSVGPDHCTLARITTVPTGEAEIVIIIDGQAQRRIVELLPQLNSNSRRISLREK